MKLNVKKNGGYFVNNGDDVLDVGQHMYDKEKKKWVKGLLLSKQDNDVSVLLWRDTVPLGRWC